MQIVVAEWDPTEFLLRMAGPCSNPIRNYYDPYSSPVKLKTR